MAKSLAEASKHIEIEGEVVQEAVEWLTQQQQVDGSFKEVGTINNEAMQGGAARGISLTSYVLIALLTVEVRGEGGREGREGEGRGVGSREGWAVGKGGREAAGRGGW